MSRTEQEMIARALEMDPSLVPYASELLADLNELGSDPASIVEVVALLNLPAGSRVVDLGCGKGANAIALSAKLGLAVLGIDLYKPFVEHCRRTADLAGVSDRCAFREGNVIGMADTLEPADVAVFAALGDVLGPLDVTMGILRQYVKPAGYIVISDAFLKDGERSAFPGFENYLDLETTRERLTAWGDAIVREVIEVSTGGERDEDGEAGFIRNRAVQLARSRPELEDHVMRFADYQASAYEYIEQHLTGAVWAIQRLAEKD